MDDFVRQRIEYADQLIAKQVAKRIENGDTILTYARSFVVEMALIRAACEMNKQFNIIIVDSRPSFEGKVLMKNLVKAFKSDRKSNAKNNVTISYTLINSISYVCKNVNKIFLGASSVLSNGAVVSRVGVANIALIAHSYKIPVAICCETYKFSERVQIDAICSNEIGDPDALIKDNSNIKNDAHNSDPILNRMVSMRKQAQYRQLHNSGYGNRGSGGGSQSPVLLDTGRFDDDSSLFDDIGGSGGGFDASSGAYGGVNDTDGQSQQFQSGTGDKSILSDWRNIDGLKILNLKYDLTPAEFVTMVITENGVIPPTSAPVIIREYHKDRELS